MNKPYISIFSFTEIKVDSVYFIPLGIKILTKHRKRGEKKGGGLAIGHLVDGKIKLEEVRVESSDILIVEGTIHWRRVRIILIYMGCSKEKKGEECEVNREIQRKFENLFEVYPEVLLICLGDLNGRLKSLEPQIETDSNGKMVEEWTKKMASNI